MKVIRKLLKGLSLTSALFVFQACYGTPQTGNIGIDEPVPAEEQPAESASAEESAAVLDEAGDPAPDA